MVAPSLDELADGMRAGMRRMAQSVCVLSACASDGTRHAMTASSVTSVSSDPASLLVCVNHAAQLHPALVQGVPLCVNLLASEMREIARRCAGGAQGEARFALGDWRSHPEHGVPYLAGAQANFFGVPDASLDYGTHRICVVRLTEVRVADGVVAPLLYVDGDYSDGG